MNTFQALVKKVLGASFVGMIMMASSLSLSAGEEIRTVIETEKRTTVEGPFYKRTLPYVAGLAVGGACAYLYWNHVRAGGEPLVFASAMQQAQSVISDSASAQSARDVAIGAYNLSLIAGTGAMSVAGFVQGWTVTHMYKFINRMQPYLLPAVASVASCALAAKYLFNKA